MDDIVFRLICSCGNDIEGAFFLGDKTEKLHCRTCGSVWEIKRPVKDN